MVRTISHPQVVGERLCRLLDLGPLLGMVVDGQACEEVAELGRGEEGVAGGAVHVVWLWPRASGGGSEGKTQGDSNESARCNALFVILLPAVHLPLSVLSKRP